MNNKQTEIDLYKIYTNFLKTINNNIKKEIAKTDNFIQLVQIATSENYSKSEWMKSFNNLLC